MSAHPRQETLLDTTKVQFDKPMSFIGLTYWTVGEGLLTGAEAS